MLAIGLLTSEGDTAVELGTAFACSRRAALTARHCICDLGPEERVLIQLRGAEPLIARVGPTDDRLDLALLELEEDLPAAFEPVPIARRSRNLDGTPFLVRGYPVERPYATDRFAIDGNIVDADASYEDGVPGLQLHSLQLGEGFELGGFSGAPVMVRLGTGSAGLRWTAVGLIVEGLVRPSGGIGHGGTIFASPVDAPGWPILEALLTEGVAFALYHETLIREFAGEYVGSATRRVPFGGRTVELARLQAWLDGAAPATMLLTGAPGAGKSALLAKFAAELDETQGRAVVYVPITVRFGLTSEATVLRALVSRLAALQGDIPVCADVEEWREALTRYLAAPTDGQRRPVVVLDGLDEAAGWQPGRWLLPVGQATGVKLLLAARARNTNPGAGWLEELGADAEAVELLALGRLDEAGIAQVLGSVDLLPSAPEPAARLRSKLSELTDGDPLVLSLYLDDALEGPGQLTAESLNDRPAGLDGYIDRWWAHQQQLWGTTLGSQKLTVPLVFNLLSCAIGPIKRRGLIELARQRTSIDGDALDDALTTLRRFVIETGEGWTISHPALAEHRRDKLEQDGDLRAVHDLFARWGTSLADADGEIPSYVVRHLSAHLVAAGAPPEAFTLFAQDRWRIAWEHESDVPDGHLADVRTARARLMGADRAHVQAGEPPKHMVDTCRCQWAIALGSESLTDVPYELVAQLLRHGLWTPSRALSFARAQPSSDSRARALALAAPYLDAAAALAGAELLIRGLDEGTDYPDPQFHAEGLGALVARLASLGHVVSARALSEGVNGEARARTALELAIAVPDNDELLATALRAVQALTERIPYWVLEPLTDCVSIERAEAAVALMHNTAPVAGAAVAWLADRLVRDPPEPTTDELARLAAWSDPASRRRITGDVLAAAGQALAGGESWAWTAVRQIGTIASQLDCAGLRAALQLVQSAQVGDRATAEEVDLLLRLGDCLQGDERSHALALALAAIPDVLEIAGTDEREDLLARLARLEPEPVLDALASLPASTWWAGDALAAIAESLDVERTRRAMDIARALRWETRQKTLRALASRLATFGVAEAHEALSLLSGGMAREEQQAALLVLEACASGEPVAGSDLMAIGDGDLRAAVMIAASHAGVLSAPAVYAGIRAFGDDERAVDTFGALSASRLSWEDSSVLAALEEVTLHVSHGRKDTILIPCFANVARHTGREATLEFAARIGKRFPRAGAWVLAGLWHLGELQPGDLELAGLAGLADPPTAPLLQMLELNRNLPRDQAFGPSFRPSMDAGEWANAVALLPSGAQADALDTVPEEIWQGPGSRDDTVWAGVALGLVPILPRARLDTVRPLASRISSATRKAALGAAFAIRLAELGDHAEAFATVWSITRFEFAARAMAEIVPVLPATELGTWMTTALRLFADREARERARTFACALPRLLALEPPALWSLIELWHSQDVTRGQLLSDLITLGPTVECIAGREAASELMEWAKRLPA